MDTAPSTAAEADPPSARADLVASAAWITFGAAVAIGAWRMDRLERLNINPYEAPGLVPGLLGALIVLLGVALALRAVRQGGLQSGLNAGVGPSDAGAHLPADDRAEGRRMAAVFGITLFYALALIGTGLPFWLATFVFITVFVGLLDRERQVTLGRSPAAQWVRAALYGAVWSAIVTLSFQHIFLVRLP